VLGALLFPRQHSASSSNSIALTLLNSLREPLGFVVRHDGVLVLSGGNPALERLLSRGASELAGMPLSRILETPGTGSLDPVDQAMAQGVAARFRAQVVDRFGAPRPVTVRVEPVGMSEVSGVAPQALVYMDPLDAEVEGLRALAAQFHGAQENLKRQAVHLGKMQQDLTAFGSMLSHDLRAPLRAIDGFTRILAEDHGEQLDALARAHLERILVSSARMNRMIDALRDLSVLTSQAFATIPVDVTALARDVADELMQSDSESKARVTVQEGLAVTGDPAMLRLLLQNLIGNGLKFSRRRPLPTIQIGVVGQSGAQQTFFVRDNGEGFDMRFSERLFGLFQRLHSSDDFPGTGIGLATARRIVRRHGGEMWARGKVGQGACFYFSLPSA
jgi:signal transduction histidine kinase